MFGLERTELMTSTPVGRALYQFTRVPAQHPSVHYPDDPNQLNHRACGKTRPGPRPPTWAWGRAHQPSYSSYAMASL